MHTLTLTLIAAQLSLAPQPLPPSGHVAAHTPAPPVFEDDEADPIAEDVEVMRRLIVRSIRGALGRQHVDLRTPFGYSDPRIQDLSLNAYYDIMAPRVSTKGFSYGLYAGAAGSVGHSRGFHMPGTGVFYSVDVEVPMRMVAQVPAAEAGDETKKDDEWARIERELHDGAEESGESDELALTNLGVSHLTLGHRPAVNWELDAEALGRAVDVVLTTLARHGARIEGLRSGESVTVAMHVTGGAISPARPFLDLSTAVDGTQAQNGALGYWWAARAAIGKREQRVVIQLSQRALAEFKGANPSAAEVKSRAVVHTY